MQINVNEIDVVNNEYARQFEVQLGEQIGFAHYRLQGTSIVFDHTVVPYEYSGQGIGHKLIKTALDYARDHDLRVVPVCPFVVAFIRENPEYKPQSNN